MHARRIILFVYLIALCAPLSLFAQPLNGQAWQSATISSGAITIDCQPLNLPDQLGRLLIENSPITTCGEMCQSLRSPHPIKIELQPESGTSDDLTAINGCTINGTQVELKTADAGDTINIIDSAAGASGAIQLIDDNPIALDSPNKIRILERISGGWMSVGGGGSLEGNLVLADGQKIDLSGITIDSATEGLFLHPQNSCATAVGEGQVCVDIDDATLYIGYNGGIVAIGGGGCQNLDDCYDQTPRIDNIGNFPLEIVDSNGDGFIFEIAAGGPRIRCVLDIDGAATDCVPSELRTIPIAPGSFSPDGTHCIHNFNQTINADIVPVAITCDDNDLATIKLHLIMPKRWDGSTLTIWSELHTEEATPGGTIEIDWTGYCVDSGDASGTNTWPTETSNGTMDIDLSAASQHDAVITSTTGSIPLTGCGSNTERSLWIKGAVDATATTADNLTSQFYIGFQLKWGSSAFTD